MSVLQQGGKITGDAPVSKVTVSVGGAVYPAHCMDPKALIKPADLALCAAKDANRTCWGSSMITFD